MKTILILLLILIATPNLLGAAKFELRETDATIEVWTAAEKGKLVLRYHKKSPELPEGVNEVYKRSGFIHPLATPDGRVVTDDFPKHHLHQHGIFFAWTSGKYRGKKIDFWNQKKQQGMVEHRKVLAKESLEDRVSFTVELSHSEQREGGGEILREQWKVTVSPQKKIEKGNHGYVIDFESRQKLVGEEPLVIEKYHYGGMAFRFSWAWRGQKGCEFSTDQGLDRIGGNSRPAKWVSVAGEIEKQPAGVAVLGHVKNFRAPQNVRIHPEMPYFCFAPMVPDGFEIKKGEEYRSRYRILVNDRPLAAEKIGNFWEAYRAEGEVR